MIELFRVSMSDTASKAAANVLESGYIGQGPKVNEFEAQLQSYLRTDYLITTNSATSALHLAMHMIKTRTEGDIEVLTTPLTCTATNWPILANGLPIKWVDVDPDTLNIDLEDLERKLSPRTKIIVIVPWGGYPVDLDRIEVIREKCNELYGFRPVVIQDCAHAFGSTFKGDPLCSYRFTNSTYTYSVYSFQAIKHLTSVDGGALVLPNSIASQRAKLLRWYGIDRESNRKDFRCEADVEEYGFKFHMNDVNAAIGIENLKKVDGVIAAHKNNADFYNKNILGIDGITLLENQEGFDSSYWIYTLKVENRDEFTKALLDKGIAASRVHERNDKHTAVKDFVCGLPSLDAVVKEMICIPVGWWVTTENRELILDTIKRGW